MAAALARARRRPRGPLRPRAAARVGRSARLGRRPGTLDVAARDGTGLNCRLERGPPAGRFCPPGLRRRPAGLRPARREDTTRAAGRPGTGPRASAAPPRLLGAPDPAPCAAFVGVAG